MRPPRPTRTCSAFPLLLFGMALAQPAAGQRTDDNAVRSAEDAFGTTVGNENIGLYTAYDVRGFSAIDAGNARIDGLYFDQQIDPVSHLVSKTSVRVGISAQGYPLPAPTGIVDYSLVRAGTKPIRSLLISVGPFGGADLEADLQLPVLADQLSVVAGGTLTRTDDGYGARGGYANAAVMPRWSPASNVELIAFASGSWAWGEAAQPAIFVNGPHLPPPVERDRFYGQDWARNRNAGANFGVLGRIDIGRIVARIGVFRSSFVQSRNFSDLFLNVDPDGKGDHLMIVDQGSRFASVSGEMRVSYNFGNATTPQILHFVLRARDQRRRYGGSDLIDLGAAMVGVPDPQPEPVLAFGPRTRDRVQQETAAVAYEGKLFGRLELSAGLQKVRYRKDTISPDASAPIESRSSPWLVNLAAALRATRRLAVYSSFTRGLEEGGVAPANAANKDAASPALRTRQVDAGIRYAFSDSFRFVIGVFDVRKPYFNVDRNGVYRQLGDVTQSGVETSLTGTPFKGLHLVAGSLFLKPRVTGEEVEAGLIGRKPIGQTGRLTIVSADYELAWLPGISLDATVTSVASRMASADNRLSIPARSLLDLAGRYRFSIGRASATLILRAGNVFDTFGWRTNSSAVFVPTTQRRASLTLVSDF